MKLDDKRLQWKLRRGMLELDLFLDTFFHAGYSDLSQGQKELFQELLEFEDDHLFRLLMGHEISDSEPLQILIGAIQRQVKQR
jgi:antitoxin CptB